MLSLKNTVESEHPACKPDFLFAYFKSLYHISYSKPLAGFVMCLILNPLFLLFLFFFFLLPCGFYKGYELLITVQVTDIESVRMMSVIFSVKIHVYFQFMFAINLPLQFTEVHG